MYLFGLSVCVFKHPIYAFRLIKADRKRFSYLPAFTILLLCVIIRVASIFLVHFPLTNYNIQDVNFLLEIGIFIIPLLSWAICSFGLSSILDGSSMMRENLTATAFCMMPYVLFQIPIVLITRLLEQNDRNIYEILTFLMWFWILLLFFISIKVINEYSIWQTVFIILITIAAIALFWATIALLYALTNQFVMFVVGLYREIRFAVTGT